MNKENFWWNFGLSIAVLALSLLAEGIAKEIIGNFGNSGKNNNTMPWR